MKEKLQSFWNQLNSKYRVRFTKANKKRFGRKLIEDFQEFGYQGEIQEKRRAFGKVENILIGNIKQAKTVIMVPYDTPAKILWYKNPFYPLNGYMTMKKSFVPTYVPILILYAIVIFITYLFPYWWPQIFSPMIVTVLTITLFILLVVLIIKGVPNINNATRNNASVMMAYDIASSLPREKRREVMFVFTDVKRKYVGNKFVQQYLEENNKKNIPVIALYCIGSGNYAGIISDRDVKAQAHKICNDLKKAGLDSGVKLITNNEDDGCLKDVTAIQDMKRAMLISTGEVDSDGELVVNKTATGKDKKVNMDLYNQVKSIIMDFLTKGVK